MGRVGIKHAYSRRGARETSRPQKSVFKGRVEGKVEGKVLRVPEEGLGTQLKPLTLDCRILWTPPRRVSGRT